MVGSVMGTAGADDAAKLLSLMDKAAHLVHNKVCSVRGFFGSAAAMTFI